MNVLNFFFGVFPYIALTIFIVGSWVRYDNAQYTWKTDSSQLLSKDNVWLASNLFHVGILSIFAGHFAGLVLPHGLWIALGVSDMDHQWLAIIAGSVLFVFWRMLKKQRPEPVPLELLDAQHIERRALPAPGHITPEMLNELIRQKPANIGVALRDWVAPKKAS